MLDIYYELTELHRRIANLITIGTIAEMNYSGACPKARVTLGEITTAWLPVLSARAGPDRTWHPPEPEEQVLVVSPSGDLAQGVIVGALSQSRFPAPANDVNIDRTEYDDGAVVDYHRGHHRLRAVLPPGATAHLEADGGVMVVGDVRIQGNVHATGDVTDGTRSMQGDRDIYNAHQHPGVRTGSGVSAAATQRQ